MLTQDRLRMLLRYDEDTGNFYRPDGAVAGTVRPDGYIQISVDGRLYRAHRLAFLDMTGAWPKHEVDHLNMVRNDNRWVNLRDVPHAVNKQNERKARGGRDGLLGVTRWRNRFKAQIRVWREAHHLGVFDTEESAHKAYVDAKRRLHAGCTI